MPVISPIGYSFFHSYDGISRMSSITPYLKPVNLLSSGGLGRLLHSAVSKDIDRELFQIFLTNKAPVEIERLCHAFMKTKLNSLELEHIADLLFSIAVNRKIRIDVPFSLLAKRMKDVGVKVLSMDKLRKLLYGLRTISTGKSVGSLNRYQREKLEFVSVAVTFVLAFNGAFNAQAVGNA